ncbi:hypothetical protein SOVF_118050 [Spinacia oleracea]|nr:hypothetical protein SOVF_118050 [Spinacia oleracea]
MDCYLNIVLTTFVLGVGVGVSLVGLKTLSLPEEYVVEVIVNSRLCVSSQ